MNQTSTTHLLRSTALALLAGVLLSGPWSVQAATSAAGLADAFQPGWFLLDQNDDQQVDALSVRVILPQRPTAEEVAAATAVAARLGFETAGLSLPLVFTSDQVPSSDAVPTIFIGAGNELLPAPLKQRISTLEPGQGLVAVSGDSLAIVGGDPLGTQLAAEAFASRSPYLWSVIGRENGDTFERITGQLMAELSRANLRPASVRFGEILYESERPEAVRVGISVALESGSPERAREALQELAERHRHGQDTDILSYSSIAELEIQFLHGTAVSQVTLPRVGLPQDLLNPPRTPPTRFQTRAPRGRRGRRGNRPSGRSFDLADIFTTGEGLLQDQDRDRIPDNVDAMIVIPAGSRENPRSNPATAHLGARLGLESTGLTFPLIGFDSQLKDPEKERRPLVLVGRENQLVKELQEQGKLRGGPLAAAVGRIEVVPKALNDSSAVVITGQDSAAEAAAINYLARRVPHIWDVTAGMATLQDARKAVAELLKGRTTAAEASLAVAEIDEVLEDLEDSKLESLSIEGYFENRLPAWEDWLEEELSGKLDVQQIEVTTIRRRDPVEVLTEEPELEWEVDTFWKRFREAAAAHIARDSRVDVEVRLSESPELRNSLRSQIEEEIRGHGALPDDVRVLGAYKQGLSWLMDEIVPRLKGRPVSSIEIGWKPLAPDLSQDHRFYNEPARWLNELYPADDVLADRLGIPLESISFTRQPDQDDTYTLLAKAKDGSTLLSQSFSTRYYERPYLEAFPEVARSLVTTGWLTLSVDGRPVVDERIPTDLDRIWDYYQGSTLKKIQDHVKSVTGRNPSEDKAPFFHTLKVELEASEPDFLLGIDQEMVSSLESMHDSFYFDTLDFFYEMARAAADEDEIPSRSLAPGNIIPWIHPERRGQAPTLKISYSGFASKDAKVVIKYKEAGKEEKSETKSLKPVEDFDPYLYLAELGAGASELSRLGFLVTLEDTDPLERVTDLLENLTRLQAEGVIAEPFHLPSLRSLTIRVEAPGAVRMRDYRVGAPSATPNPEPYSGHRLVTWDHVISPRESEEITHTLGTLPNVTSYVAGESYQGRPVSVMEIKLPMKSELVSQAKLSTWKPVLSITGRQHANEVSSTSHILRLAELLATDPKYTRYLEKMNIVIQPVVNPDGAALAYELQKLTPRFCLHAGRYSALGPDVPGQANNPDTLVTEALVLSKIDDTWLPDIRLNPHGYPSHEWVQHFANYNPKSFRAYWIPRGWYTSVRIPEHPSLEDSRDVSLALRDQIAEEVTRDPAARETNLRIYDRYRRWAIRWQPHVYNLELHNDTAIYSSRTGGTVQRPSSGPQTTIFSGYTEAMDETAQGKWLDLVTRMGFGYLMASVKFLNEAEYELFRIEEERGGSIYLSVIRPRPVRPGPKSRALEAGGRNK